MLRLGSFLLVMATVSACGGRKGPEAGVTYYWQIKSASVVWGDSCSDDPDFRASVTTPATDGNTYFTYKVESDGKHATHLTCTTFNPSECTPSSDGAVMDIAGSELTWSGQSKSQIGTSACNLVQDATWTFEDKILHFTFDMSNLLSLSGTKSVCDSVEANQKAKSPNGLGVQGCVVTVHLGGDFR
jgi:hypothetical protein